MGLSINRGILTGFNEAFIISTKKNHELTAEDPKYAEIIRPILRGRDIKRYGYTNPDLWLLFIPWHFPLQDDGNIVGASKEAEKLFEERYPAVYKHLYTFKDALSKRNKAETGIRYEWYALQRWGAKYKDDFSKLKIMYPNMTKYLPFYLDTKGFVSNDKSFIISGSHLEYLVAFLNSNLFKFCFRDSFPELLGGTRELRKIFFDKIPVMKVSDSVNQTFSDLVFKIQTQKMENNNTESYENSVNNMIYKLYHITEEEATYIDSWVFQKQLS